MNHDVFISYSSRNPEAAKAICHILEENGIKCWLAPRDIPPGQNYGDLIDSAILSCKVFLLVYSSESLVSPWCKGEVNVAFAEGKPIVPYRIDDTPLKGAMRVILNQTHWIDSYPDFRVRFDELVQTIGRIVGVEVARIKEVEAEQKTTATLQPTPAPTPTPTPPAPPKPKPFSHKWFEPFVKYTIIAFLLLGLFVGLGILMEEDGSDYETTAEAVYEVGDYYDDGVKKGVVFEVTDDGKHGKIVSLKAVRRQWATDAMYEIPTYATAKTDGAQNMQKIQAIDGGKEKFPAFAWCASLGEGWYLPAIEELLTLSSESVFNAVNQTLRQYACELMGECVPHWSSSAEGNEYGDEFCAWLVSMGNGHTDYYNKISDLCVRAVSAF